MSVFSQVGRLRSGDVGGGGAACRGLGGVFWKRAPKIVDNLPSEGVKNGQKTAFCNCLFSRYHLLIKFYPSSYQILTKFYASRRWSEFVNNFFRRWFRAALSEREFSVVGVLGGWDSGDGWLGFWCRRVGICGSAGWGLGVDGAGLGWWVVGWLVSGNWIRRLDGGGMDMGGGVGEAWGNVKNSSNAKISGGEGLRF